MRESLHVCVIPTTRGGSRSLAAAKVMAQVRGFVAAGGKELVLSGINLGRWGRDLAEHPSFAGLVRKILEETGVPRLRLSSIEPMDWTVDLIELLREFGGGRLARHTHLPLQSGSDAVLRRMHRRYRPWHYEQKAALLREAVGVELALGADVMVGFPGETEAEFCETYELIARLNFAYLHLFPFRRGREREGGSCIGNLRLLRVLLPSGWRPCVVWQSKRRTIFGLALWDARCLR